MKTANVEKTDRVYEREQKRLRAHARKIMKVRLSRSDWLTVLRALDFARNGYPKNWDAVNRAMIGADFVMLAERLVKGLAEEDAATANARRKK